MGYNQPMNSAERFKDFNLQDFIAAPDRRVNNEETRGLADKMDIFHTLAGNAQGAGFDSAADLFRRLADDVDTGINWYKWGQHKVPIFAHHDPLSSRRAVHAVNIAEGVFKELTEQDEWHYSAGRLIADHRNLQEYSKTVVHEDTYDSRETLYSTKTVTYPHTHARVQATVNGIRSMLGASQDVETTPAAWKEGRPMIYRTGDLRPKFLTQRFEAATNLGVTLVTEFYTTPRHEVDLVQLTVKKASSPSPDKK
jgi:hypothetical protein